MVEDHFIVVRVYHKDDETECRKLLEEGVMSAVKPAFFMALTREVTFQIIITMAAAMFVFMGLSPTFCIFSIPATIIFIYICIYGSLFRQASFMKEKAVNISKKFLSSKYTCFWVAELYEQFPLKNISSQVKFLVLQEHQLECRLQDDNIFKKKIIGIVGVDRCDKIYESAWIKDMIVNYKYQRRGIGTALLNKAIEFCINKGYESIELVTSECHSGARTFYLQKGFKLRQLYHKPILGPLVQVLMYQFTLALPVNTSDKKTH